MTQVNDIITDEDMELYSRVAAWCNDNGAVLTEIGPESGHRRFQVLITVCDPSYEEQRYRRSVAYQNEVDPITNHIQRLRDEAEPNEERIKQLLEERALKVKDIQERYPYPEKEDA